MINKTTFDNYPYVQFDYPNSETNRMVQRLVRVTSMDNTYITGYELQFNGDAVYKYKKYLMNRIATNGITLLAFTPAT